MSRSPRSLFAAALAAAILLAAAPVTAGLDFGRPQLAIPDTHKAEDYRWQAARDPAGFDAVLRPDAGGDYRLHLALPATVTLAGAPRLFLTDPGLSRFSAMTPRPAGGNDFLFTPGPVPAGRTLVEVALPTSAGWVHLHREVDVAAGPKPTARLPLGAFAEVPPVLAAKIRPRTTVTLAEGYTVNVERFPTRAYAGHVVTLVLSISRDGRPLAELDNLAAAAWRRPGWFRPARDFLPADLHRQSDGQRLALSFVPESAGDHRLLVQFRHAGGDHVFALDLTFPAEPAADNTTPWTMAPAE